MTRSQDRTTKEQEAKDPRRKPDVHELDTEIVKDLEVDGRADDVRGGMSTEPMCPK